jgi:hypothetical protein
MPIKHVQTLNRIIIDDDAVAVDYHDAFVDGDQTLGETHTVKTFKLAAPTVEADGEALRLHGHFPAGAEMSFRMGGKDHVLVVPEPTSHHLIVDLLKLPKEVFLDVQSIDIGGDFDTLMSFYELDGDAVNNLPVTAVKSKNLDPPDLPDEVLTVLRSLLPQ